MVFYYLVRDVVRGADCSYRPGRTLLDSGSIMRDRAAAQRHADRYNECCHVAGVFYLVVPHDDNTPFDCDYYESRPHHPTCAPDRPETTTQTEN